MTFFEKIAAAFIVAVLLLVAGAFTLKAHDERIDKIGYDRAVAEYKDRELKAVKKAREEEQAKTAAAAGVADDARKQVRALQNALRDAEQSGGKLRNALASARRLDCAASQGTAVAGGSPPASATEGVLADVQRRLDEAADRIARYADEAHIAGATCERLYEQVNQ